jgi:spore coat polysaccharide biosynthesis protein SpsF
LNSLINIVTVLQARTGSSRLPNKIFLPLYEKPLIYRLYERIEQSKLKGTIVIATTTDKTDDEVEKFCKDYQISCYRGHPFDLLDRHYQAAKYLNAGAVIKIPSDCPLIDADIIDKVIKYYLDNLDKFDFVSNLHPPSYPDGNDVEIFSFNALEKTWINAKRDYEREHTTPYMWENSEKFRIGNIAWEKGLDYSMSHRFTIDYEKDYNFIKQVYDELYPLNPKFTLEDILNLLLRKPGLKKINEEYCGVNWYRNHLNELRTIKADQTKII